MTFNDSNPIILCKSLLVHLLWKSVCRIFHVLRVVSVNGVDAGDCHVLLAVAEVLDGAEFPPWLELIVRVEPPVEIEEVDFKFGLCDTKMGSF